MTLQWVDGQWLDSVSKCHWWWVFTLWACNDVAPGISIECDGSPFRGWMNHRACRYSGVLRIQVKWTTSHG